MVDKSKVPGTQRRGQAPFGFRWHEGELVIVPGEAETLRLMFELYRKCKTSAGVSDELNRLGKTTRRKGSWGAQQVGRHLAKPVAIGRHEIRSAGSGGETEGRTEIVHCEPAVSKELWDAVQAIRAEGADLGRTGGRPLAHAMAGLVYCSCGGKMEVPTAEKKKFVCPDCKQRVPVEQLDEVIAQTLGRFVGARAGRADASGLDWGRVKLAGELSQARQSLVAVEGEMAKLERLVVAGKLGEDRFAQQHALANAERERLVAETGRLEKALAKGAVAGEANHGGSPPGGGEFLVLWPTLAVKVRRQIIVKLLDRVVIDSRRGEIVICSPHEDLFFKVVTFDEQTKNRAFQLAEQALAGAPALIPLPPDGEKCPYTGLSRSALNRLVLESFNVGREPPVASTSIPVSGQKQGVRRIYRDSLVAYLAAHSK